MNTFGHSGDLGDIIFSLPAIRAMGGGILYLINYPGRTTFPMTQERVDAIRPLLMEQRYISDVVFAGDDLSKDSAINGFRDHCCPGRNLADAHLSTHDLPPSLRNNKWLRTGRVNRVSPVVFSKSARYPNPSFSWSRIVGEYGRQAVFLGTPQEYEEFASKYGPVDYVRTRDLLEAAEIIAGAQLFVGNQSCLSAIAEGLKQNKILEVYPDLPNVIFNRLGVINAWNDDFELPGLSSIPQSFASESVPVREHFSGVGDALCINLRRRPDRWRLFQYRNSDRGLNFFRRFDAIDGDSLNIPSHLRSHRGTYGCLYSHAAIYRAALSQGFSHVMVAEDDCVFVNDTNAVASYLKSTMGTFAFIHLDGSRNCWPEVKARRSTHVEVSNILNSHAYVVNSTLMKLYVDYLETDPFPTSVLLHSDRLLIHLCRTHGLGACMPPRPLAQQDKLLAGDVQWGTPLAG